MRLAVRHVTTYRYEPPPVRVALRLRLWPTDFDGQRAEGWQVAVNGDPVAPFSTDSWGQAVGLWQAGDPGEGIEITASGQVLTEDRAGVVSGLPVRPPEGVFLRTTPLTEASDAVVEFAAAIPEQDRLSWLHALCRAVGEAVVYRPRVTGNATSAAEALQLGAGVCQDQTHLFIAAARSKGIPARYVVGYLLAEDGSAAEVETHAWAEAAVPGLGWVGFDPTHTICPTDRYVRLGCGLDSHDAAPVQGVVIGQSTVSVAARVAIGAEDDGQAQEQQ